MISAINEAVFSVLRLLEVALSVKLVLSLVAVIESPEKAARPLLQLMELVPERVAEPLVTAIVMGVPDRCRSRCPLAFCASRMG
jgi:hypothetical protein